jgi:glycosyltransferase involved in cell wall biosynthesis
MQSALPADTEVRVGVVVATHNRPELVRRAIASILAQDFAGTIELALVFDRSEPDMSLARDTDRREVRVLTNTRTPGLAGARNTGILALDTDVVAFCDDDDTWLPDKLTTQLARLRSVPDAGFVTTSMRVDYGERSSVRQAGRERIEFADLLRSRMAMLHSSSYLFRREAMLGPDGFGLVDETLPRSMSEDWDILLRVARKQPIEHVDTPLIAVTWGMTSYFNDAWSDKIAAHEWLMTHHPEFRADRRAHALMLGKLAFGHAALGHRRAALRAAGRALRANWREPRTPVALLVVLGVSPGWVMAQLNKRGHGI